MRALHIFQRYLGETENWSFTTLSELPNVDIVVAARYFLKNNFFSSRFEYIEFPLLDIVSQRTSWFFSAYNKLVGVLRRLFWLHYVERAAGEVDLMHSHFGHVGWRNLPLARRLGVPHIVSFYGGDYEKIPYEQPVWLERYAALFEQATMFVCEGPHGAALLRRQGVPSRKIRVCRIGINVTQVPFAAREKRRQALDLVQVATITEKKGHRFTVEAFLRILPECPNATLTLVGSARTEAERELGSTLRKLVRDAGAEEQVHFVGQVRFSRLYEYLADYHVFIHPSVYAANRDCEGGAPIVLLNAQATGMPVIASEHCDIPDEVIHEQTGVLAPERDVEGLAKYIRRFYDMDQAEYDRFSAAARKHVEDNFDVKQNARQLRAIYDEVLISR